MKRENTLLTLHLSLKMTSKKEQLGPDSFYILYTRLWKWPGFMFQSDVDKLLIIDMEVQFMSAVFWGVDTEKEYIIC